MRICVAQTRPARGDIQTNIDNHKKFIETAISNAADTIIFPELSITGYEPELAQELSTGCDDSRFDDFQQISDTSNVTIGIGAPTKTNAGICISMLLFQPQKARQTYSKKYLHPDELPFFTPGQNSIGLTGYNSNISLAICYELSVPEHAENAFRDKAEIYIASVAKSAEGVEKSIRRLSEISSTYRMVVLMSNCVGQSGGMECGGKTSVWNNGMLAGQLNDSEEAILVYDTQTLEVIESTI